MPALGHCMTPGQQAQTLDSSRFLHDGLRHVVRQAFASIMTAQASLRGTQRGLTNHHQVVTGLATLQSAVQDLSRAYIAHTNTVIGKAPGVPGDYLGITPLGTEGLFGTASTASAANGKSCWLLCCRTVVVLRLVRHNSQQCQQLNAYQNSAMLTSNMSIAEASGPKKRKRAPHDTNAPKRPVTPYFLYMKTKKQEIANEMPQGHTAKQVSEEGARRWNAMTETEKKVNHPLTSNLLKVNLINMYSKHGATSMP